jgi:uncharacterized membrane protein
MSYRKLRKSKVEPAHSHLRPPWYTLRRMSVPKRVLLLVMGVFYIAAGVMHFAQPAFYLPMMPPYLPLHRELIFLSGLAELLLGAAVLEPATRRWAGWGLIALLIAIFPANLHIALHNVPVFGAQQGAGIGNWIRLPFQLVLIAWAWWYTRPEEERSASAAAQAWSSVAQPAALRRLEQLSHDRAAVEAALQAVQTQSATGVLDLGIAHHCIEDTPAEANHMRADWFDARRGWWKHLPPIDPILRAAFTKAGQLAIEHHLPIDGYWIRRGDDFRVAVCRSPQQITMLFISPVPPIAVGAKHPVGPIDETILEFRADSLSSAVASAGGAG